MTMCPQVENSGMVAGILDTVDCHIRVLVHDSYRSLVGPDTWFAAAFTAMLTIYVALIGYQLMIGRGGLRVADLPTSALKIGLIFAFLTSWAAYQTLVFDFLFDGPSEIVSALVGPMSEPGFDGNVLGGVQRAFEEMTGVAGIYGAMASPTANLLQGGPMLASGILWMSAMLMILITLGLVIAGKDRARLSSRNRPCLHRDVPVRCDTRPVPRLVARHRYICARASRGLCTRRGDAPDAQPVP
jgi:type IV secretion system protein VirB6